MALVRFSDIKNVYSSTQLSKLLNERIDKKDLFQPEAYLIAYSALKKINFRKLTKDKESVTSHCLMVDQVFIPKIKHEDGIEFFLKLIFDLGKLPVYEKLRLEERAKKDIHDIDLLLNDYRQLPFIKSYEEQPIVPRSHFEKTVLEFYKRTINKRNEILDYIVNKVDRLAIEKSQTRYLGFAKDFLKSENIRKLNVQSEFPYLELVFKNKGLDIGINWEKLDYRRINPLRHKRVYFQFQSGLHSGYTKAIKKEVASGFTKNHALHLLSATIEKVEDLPVLKRRKKIFQSLKSLYKNNQWYGFYALALPQIEGIFSEMASIVNPSDKKSIALPDKVKRVREFSDHSEYSFDYYEYFLPDQRNKFSHTGNDDEIQIKCAFLVMDLAHITSVFEELKSPLLEMNSILQQGAIYFEHIGRFAHFLKLYRSIKEKRQLGELEKEINALLYNELCPHFDFDAFLLNLEIDFKDAAQSFESLIIIPAYQRNEELYRIFSLTPQDLHQKMKLIETDFLDGGLQVAIEEDYKLLVDTYHFVTGYPKEFDRLPKKLVLTLQRFSKKYESQLKILGTLEKGLKNVSLPEDFLIKRTSLKHLAPSK